MRRTLLTAFATLGMVVSGAVTTVLVVGIAEGIHELSDPTALALSAAVFLAAMALAGRVAVDVGGDRAFPGVALAAGLVIVGGLLAAKATESNGEGLELGTVAELGAGLVVLLTASVLASRRGDRSRRAQPTIQP